MNPTVLVTGAAGFIGSRTAETLLDQGFRVVGIDNLNPSYDVRLKEHRRRRLAARECFTFYELDVESRESLAPLFRERVPDCVFHLAARAGVRQSMEDPRPYFTTNTLGTLNLLELMKEYGGKKLVLASTSSLYAGQEMPFRESLAVNTPISPYAASKKAAELLAYTYHYLYQMDVSVLRYFTVYGPAGRPDMSIFRFIQWIDRGTPIELFGDGSQSRDFTFVDDIAAGTVLAARPVGYEIINLGGGNRPVSLSEVIRLLEEFLGKKAELRHKPFHQADIKETQADISKARAVLGWEPRTSLEEGLQKTVRWYQDHLPWSAEILLP
jgi:UDP-glucuronate 4-epimerase